MKEKKKREKKSIITLAVLLVIIITAVVTQITSGIISWAYISMKEFFYPPRLELTLNKCFIYRTDLDNFPTCELDIVAYNPSHNKKITVELKELKLFREEINYNFSRGQVIIRVDPEDLITKQVVVTDKVFESAFKIPQDSVSAIIRLRYNNVSKNSIDSLILSDDDVIKCTYWQRPIFNSEKEVFDVGARVLEISPEVFFTDRLGKHGKIQPKIEVCTN